MLENCCDTSVWTDESNRLLFRLRGSVIRHIWPKILLVVVYTVIIVGIHNAVDVIKFHTPISLIVVLSTVMGLLLAFRTNTAYARFWEGRTLYAKMTGNVRTITRTIWIAEKTDENESEEDRVKHLIEKVSAINLLIAFLYATKNYLREEYSYEKDDLKDLIGHLPRFCKGESEVENAGQKEEGGSSEGTRCEVVIPHDSVSGKNERRTSMFCLKAHDYHPPTNIPLEISYHLFGYMKRVLKKGNTHYLNAGFGYSAIGQMTECLTGFERILRTPIPIAYSVHLSQCVWLYLISLPYQLLDVLNWYTIPATALASFAFFGILRIGREIENPFGYDDNDLPLDDFCAVIRKEIEVIVGNTMPDLDSWILSTKNFPLSPNILQSADQLIQKSMSELGNFFVGQQEPGNISETDQVLKTGLAGTSDT